MLALRLDSRKVPRSRGLRPSWCGYDTSMALSRSLPLPARYARVRPLGRGGMAEIYLAHDVEFGRSVAVKVLDERLAELPEARRRFTREAKAAARLSGHPHIATIYDVGEVGGRPFMVMEFLSGGALSEQVRAGPVDRVTALRWLRQAASALDAAHAEGVVHRDIKPANLLLDGDGDVRVADCRDRPHVAGETGGGLTATGEILGTSGYLSPEQAAGQGATAASGPATPSPSSHTS